MVKLTIIVPVYNEEQNLLRVEAAFLKFFESAFAKAQVLFINDGSTDGSQGLIETICGRNQNFSYLTLSENSGLSAAIKAGFDHTETPLVGYIDADLQTTPEDFNLLLQEMGDHAIVTGVRANRKDSTVKNLSSKIANSIRRAFTRDGMEDTGCPLKILKTEYAKCIPMFRGLHRFLPAMILLQGGTVKQVPVRHFERVAGSSKFGLRNRLLGPLVDCFAYLWMKRKYINYSVKKSSRG